MNSDCRSFTLSSSQHNDNVPSSRDAEQSCSSLSSSEVNDNVASTSGVIALTSETWTDNAVKLLIEIYKANKEKFDSPSFTKKKVWEIISTKLNKYGYNKSGVKCDEKWRNLRKTYDKVRTEINKTGNAKVTWKFYEDFQEMYWKDPFYVPVATASTTTIKRKLTDTNIEENSSTKTKKLCPGEKRKPVFSAADIEMRRQQRHEESMNLKKEIFAWFKENQKNKNQ